MSQRIHDLPEEDRPRERLMRLGPEALSDAELLGIFINTGMKGENAVQIGSRLLAQHGGLRRLSRRNSHELAQSHGLGPAKAATLAAAFELGCRAERETLRETVIKGAEDTFNIMGREMQALSFEEVHVILVNTRHAVIHRQRIFRGTLNESVCHPRELLKPALLHTAHGFIVVHNHPSGDPQPSQADRSFTRQLKQASVILQIHFLDHIIIGHPAEDRARAFFSFAEAGLM
jgi:DNA repair protein RadC